MIGNKSSSVPEKSSPVLKVVNDFFSRHRCSGKPVLIGLSGGPDSLALFLALRRLRIPLEVAHVDHGWREESRRQADALQRMVESQGIRFHRASVSPPPPNTSWEDIARQQRLAFFGTLCERDDYEAVVLAHHRDDLVETVFKRLVDGASLDKLCGLRPVHRHGSLTLWRPLLQLAKQELIDWVTTHEIHPFEDPTNGAEYCFRGVLRERVFPYLRQELRRPIEESMAHLGHCSLELEEFLDEWSAPILRGSERGAMGKWVDVGAACRWHRVPLRHLVRRFCAQSGLVLSREGVEVACELLEKNKVGQVSRGNQVLHVDRGRLFICDLIPSNIATTPLNFERTKIGPWVVEVRFGLPPSNKKGWEALWKGNSWCSLPEGDYSLTMPVPGRAFIGGQTLSRHYNKRGIPTFLRNLVPVICNQDRVVADFLTPPNGSKNMGQPDMISVGVDVSLEDLGTEHKPHKLRDLQ